MMVSLRRHGPGALPVRSTLGTLGEGDIGLENPIRLRHLADDPGLGPPSERGALPCSVSASTNAWVPRLAPCHRRGRWAHPRRAPGDVPCRGSVSHRRAEGDVPVEMV